MLMANIAELGSVRAMLNQYSQKQRKPCQGPKSRRVQAYRPPASGCLWIRAATATPSGAANSTAAAIQSSTDPGPAPAATAIQRGPMMQAIANKVRSRSPSSRWRWTRCCLSGIQIEGCQEGDFDIGVFGAEDFGGGSRRICLRKDHRGAFLRVHEPDVGDADREILLNLGQHANQAVFRRQDFDNQKRRHGGDGCANFIVPPDRDIGDAEAAGMDLNPDLGHHSEAKFGPKPP